MLQELQTVRNPALRGFLGAGIVFSIVTGISSIVVGVTGAKGENTYRNSVMAALVGTLVGGVGGTLVKPEPNDETLEHAADETYGTMLWKDWRSFTVVQKVKESEGITSFYLKPTDGGGFLPYKPGQFLTLKLNIPGRAQSLIRTYSLSDFGKTQESYRLSVKREHAPKGLDVLPGIGSTFMHDQVEVGSMIPIKPPTGKFFLEVDSPFPAILISNGVGITPMIAMAKACLLGSKQRPVWFLHGARSSQEHAFRAEIDALQQLSPHFHIYYCYSRPLPTDAGLFHHEGYVDQSLLETVIMPEIERIHGSRDAEFFLCGSPAFMDALRQGLSTLQVPDRRIFFESFMRTRPTVPEEKPQEQGGGVEITTAEVIFSRSGKTLTWKNTDGSILDLAESNGLNLPYSCRAGICLTCMCPMLEGAVEYDEPPTGSPDRGSILPCIAKPKSQRIALDA